MEQKKEGEKSLERRIRHHLLGKEHDFFAVVQPGFEATAMRELAALGIPCSPEHPEGGVGFRSRLGGCYRANLSSRTVSRIIMRLLRFRAERFNALRIRVSAFPWELYLMDGTAVEFDITARKSRLYHKGRIEEEARRGIMERLGDNGMAAVFHGKGEGGAAQKIFLRLDDNICQVSLDTSGDLLYRRGEKTETGRAPIRETLAACILMEARIDSYDTLIDPMCGSGTFALEAMGILLKKTAGAGRDFAFTRWPAFRPAAFRHLKKELEHEGGVKEGGALALASDVDPQNVRMTAANLARAGLEGHAEISARDFFRDPPPVPAGRRALIVLNPPYGERLPAEDLGRLYRNIGKTIRERYPGSGYAVISPGLEYEKIMSLPYDRKILFMNGGIRVAVIMKDAP